MLLLLVPVKTTVISLQNTVFLKEVVLPQPVVWPDQVDYCFASSDDEFPEQPESLVTGDVEFWTLLKKMHK